MAQKLRFHHVLVLGCLPGVEKVVGEHHPPTGAPPILPVPSIGFPIEQNIPLIVWVHPFEMSNFGSYIYIYDTNSYIHMTIFSIHI